MDSGFEDEAEVGGGGEFFEAHAAGDVFAGPAFEEEEFLAVGMVAGDDGGVEGGFVVGPGGAFCGVVGIGEDGCGVAAEVAEEAVMEVVPVV